MKRLVLLLVVFTVSCSQQPIANAVRLVGTHDLALVGDRLFVTSTDRNEIKVLDLAPPGLASGSRQFMPAPNPIEPLSIPVLSRPSSLTKDIHWVDAINADGTLVKLSREVAGPWVYATRSGGAEISVIAAARDQLFEAQLTDNHTPLRIPTAAPVTASAAYSFAAGLCSTASDCATGQICGEGICFATPAAGSKCANSSQCGAGQTCFNEARLIAYTSHCSRISLTHTMNDFVYFLLN